MEPDELDLTADAQIPCDLVVVVRRILHDKQVPSVLAKLGGRARFRIEAIVDQGQSLASAHANWQPGSVSHVKGLAPFARQSADAITPGSLVRVTCECIEEITGGMSSYYGFRGHFVSLLISAPAGAVWDARVEEAS